MVNVFVNMYLDEMVFIRHPSGFENKAGCMVLRLKKAFYKLQRSPFL